MFVFFILVKTDIPFVLDRGGSKTAATSNILERFMIIVNGFQPLTVITKRSILDVAAVLDPPLLEIFIFRISSSASKLTQQEFIFNYGNTRTMREICSKLKIKTPEGRRRPSGVFIVNFEKVSHMVLVFLLLTSNN